MQSVAHGPWLAFCPAPECFPSLYIEHSFSAQVNVITLLRAREQYCMSYRIE